MIFVISSKSVHLVRLALISNTKKNVVRLFCMKDKVNFGANHMENSKKEEIKIYNYSMTGKQF